MGNYIGCIIQARMGSSRLPGKVMKRLDGKNPMLFYVITQMKHCKLLNKIVVATTNEKIDDQIVKYVQKLGVDCFRGNTLDVLDRHYQCAKKYSISAIVRISSDNPLTDPQIVDSVIEKFNSNSYDYVTTWPPITYPQGTNVEIFGFKALENAWHEAKRPSEREHMSPFFFNNKSKFKIFQIKYSKNLSHLRWTVDRENDLEFVRAVVSKIKKRPILLGDILNLLSREPDLIEINKDHIVVKRNLCFHKK